MPKTALIAGASGLVGEHLLAMLLASPDYEQVISLGRRWLDIQYPKLKQIAVDFDALQTVPDTLRVDDVFCSLGTTIKKAGSREAFRKVDFSYVVNAARLGQSLGAGGCFVVSALGAHPRSRVFYSRTKGEMEEALKSLNFDSLAIFRPSLITGHRKESRPGERLAVLVAPVVTPLLAGPLRKYRPIAAEAIAEAMVQAAHEHRRGVHSWESDGKRFWETAEAGKDAAKAG